MKKMSKKKKAPFEVVAKDENRIVLKRTTSKNKKGQRRTQNTEARCLSLHYFDEDDYRNLKRIEKQINASYVPDRPGPFQRALKFFFS